MPISKSEPMLPAAAPILPVPTRIGRYAVIDRIATGGMAEIFVCCERGMAGLERLVVVKRILPHLAVHEQFVAMFLAEARFVARLNHPNVVQIFELGEDGGAPYLAMEYVAGASLRDVVVAAIERDQPTPLGATLSMLAQACAGAHAAHELTDPAGLPLGLVHRDISPHNLMVTAEGHVKLLDFGIAKATETASLDDNTRTGALKGKVHYMAPEQIKQEQLDRRADIFALAVVGWELLAQERLFKRDNELDAMQAITTGEVKDLRKLRKDIPTDVVAVLERALQVKRDARWATADEMRHALLEAAARHNIRTDIDVAGAFVKPLLGEAHKRKQADLMAQAQERTRATPAEPDSADATLVEKKTGAGVKAGTKKKPAAAAAADKHSRTDHVPRVARRRRSRALIAAAGALVALAATTAVVVYAMRDRLFPPSGPPLVLAWAPVADAEAILKDVAPFERYLERALDRRIDVVVASSYADLQSRLLSGQADVGVLPPTVYVRTREAGVVDPIATKLVDGSSGSDGVLYTRDDTDITAIDQLKGRRFCFTDPLSTTGWVLPRAALRRSGVDPDRDVIKHMSGNHVAVLRDLVAGKCDAGAVYSGGYLAADREGVPVQRLRQIAITGRSPQDAVCAGPGLDDATKKKLREALLRFDGKRDGGEGVVERISSFAPTNDSDYDQLRKAIASEVTPAP